VKPLSEVLTPEEQGQTPTPDLIKMSNAFGQLKEDTRDGKWRAVGIAIAVIGIVLVLGLAGWSDAHEYVR
jgi:hypothetical protein